VIWDYPIRRGPLFWAIEAGELKPPPLNIVELDVKDWVARERRELRRKP
jgi:hypothetical protein